MKFHAHSRHGAARHAPAGTLSGGGGLACCLSLGVLEQYWGPCGQLHCLFGGNRASS